MVSTLTTALSPYRRLSRLLIRNRPLDSSLFTFSGHHYHLRPNDHCRSRSSLGSIMSFHFGSSGYAKCFLDLPQPNTQEIRQSALNYLKAFDANHWYADPVSSVTLLVTSSTAWIRVSLQIIIVLTLNQSLFCVFSDDIPS